MWNIWDKKTSINGCSAERFLDRNKFLKEEDTVFIKIVDGKVTNVEGKKALSIAYGIDPTLPDDEFIAEYERILAEPVEEATEDLTEGG